MLVQKVLSPEEEQQALKVKEAYDLLNSYDQRISSGQEVDASALKALTDDIINTKAPLAEQLGMYAEQKEMLDSSVRLSYPEDYAMLKKLLIDSEAMCEIVFKTFSLPIKAMLDDMGIEYEFKYRMKSVYSIWRKMRIDHKQFDDVYDLFATRIVYKVPEKALPLDTNMAPPEGYIDTEDNIDVEKLYCWRIYNVISMLYRIHPDRIKDWVTHPKPSGYRAVQLTVMGPDCNWIEIQIRSEQMDYDAEEGAAAHWKYKAETKAM
jgi:GTP pyrophosphokinase